MTLAIWTISVLFMAVFATVLLVVVAHLFDFTLWDDTSDKISWTLKTFSMWCVLFISIVWVVGLYL